MSLFKSKKKELAELEALKKRESEDPKVNIERASIDTSEEPLVKDDGLQKPISLESLIINNSDVWYKAQVLNLLISINDKFNKNGGV